MKFFLFGLVCFSYKREKGNLGCQITLSGYEGGQRKKSGQDFS